MCWTLRRQDTGQTNVPALRNPALQGFLPSIDAATMLSISGTGEEKLIHWHPPTILWGSSAAEDWMLTPLLPSRSPGSGAEIDHLGALGVREGGRDWEGPFH